MSAEPIDELGRLLVAANSVGVYGAPHAPGALSADEAIAWYEQSGRRLSMSGDWRRSSDGIMVPCGLVVCDVDRPWEALDDELLRAVRGREQEPALRRAAVLAVFLTVLAASLLLSAAIVAGAVGLLRWAF